MEDFTLETAENVSLHYDIATAGSRAAAVLLDFIIIVIVSAGLFVLADFSQMLGADILSAYLIAVMYLVVGTLSWGYFVMNEIVFDGSSLGKRLLGLRVIKENGSPIDLVDSLTRNFIRLVDLWPGTYLIGFIAMMLNDRSKRLGDFAAGTLVVRGRSVELDTLELGKTPYDRLVKDNPRLSSITPHEYQLMRDFLVEIPRLPPEKSASLAYKLAEWAAKKLSVDTPTGFENRVHFITSCVKYYD